VSLRRDVDGPGVRDMIVSLSWCAMQAPPALPGLPTALISFDDAEHLPPGVRWTGFPAPVRPASG
jgi:serine/threonine-protein phosphatase PGAM5